MDFTSPMIRSEFETTKIKKHERDENSKKRYALTQRTTNISDETRRLVTRTGRCLNLMKPYEKIGLRGSS